MAGNGVGVSGKSITKGQTRLLAAQSGDAAYSTHPATGSKAASWDCGLSMEIGISNSPCRHSVSGLTFNLTPGCYKFACRVSFPVADHHVSN